MINVLHKFYLIFLFFLYATASVASQDIQIEQQVTLAVDKQLKMPDGTSLSIVKTNELTDDSGNLLKGRHQLFFTSRTESTIPVVVNGINVNPGETVEFTVNLTLTSNRLYFPIYPSVAGAAGEIFYDINLPSLSISNCPDEYEELTSGACKKSLQMAGEYVCPDDYTRTGTECSLARQIRIGSACPLDYSLVDGECIKESVVEAKDSCDSGFTLNESGICEQNIVYPMEYTCPDGYTLDIDNSCKRTYSITPGESCSDGYVKVGEQCERVLELAVGSCEAGFALISGECFEQGIPLEVCPHGYSRNGDSCELVEAGTPLLDCQDGFALNADNQCVERTEVLVSGVACPPDAVNDNGTCKIKEFSIQDNICGTGQIFDGSKCIHETVKPITQCKEGWVLINGNCYEKHGYELICPEGFTYADDHCERVDIVNKQQCPEDFTFNEAEQNCYKTVITDAIERCPIDFAFMNGQCQREVMVTPQGCTAGHILTDGRCFEVAIPNYICPDGYEEDSGKCVKVSITDISLRCPDEYVAIDGHCEKLVIQDAIQQCSNPDYSIVNEECLKITEIAANTCEQGYTMIDGLCYRTQEPMYYCDNDYVLSEDKSICTKVSIKDAFQTCPDTFENIGNECERRSTISPELECPLGYTPANGRCEMYVSINTSQCPKGQVYKEDGTCATVTALELSCPNGMSLRDGSCYEVITSDRESCESGYSYNDGQCYEILEEELVCDIGEESVSVGGALICKETENKTFCADGFYFDGNQCIDDSGNLQDRADYCPDGFTYSNDNGIERCVNGGNLSLTHAALSCPQGASQLQPTDCLSLCPEGSQDVDGVCQSISTVKYESKVCLSGNLYGDQCWITENTEPGQFGYQCPLGAVNVSPAASDPTSRLGYAKTCLETKVVDKAQVCMNELGLTGPACLTVGTRSENVAEVCPNGMTINSEGECVAAEEPELACSDVTFNGPNSRTVNTYMNSSGSCVSYVEVDQQEAYQCPVGFKPIYQYEGIALPSQLNPNNVVSEGVSSDVLSAFQSSWSSVNFISSSIDDEHKVTGTPEIKDFLCVSDTVTLIEADLGVSPEHTFTDVFNGTMDYGIEGETLVGNISSLASRYMGDYISGKDEVGDIYNYEFLRAISRSPSKTTINGYIASLSTLSGSSAAISVPGSNDVKEYIKLYPVKGYEDKFIIASMLLAGSVEGFSSDAGNYIKRAMQNGQPSAIDIIGGCSVKSEELIGNISTYNKSLSAFLDSLDGYVIAKDGVLNEDGEESCFITYQHKDSSAETCPLGMEMNAKGQCESSSSIGGAQSCEAISEIHTDYKCPIGMQLSGDKLSCITKSYSPAYSCEFGDYNASTGLCVRDTQCKEGYEVYGSSCAKRITCDEVLGLSGSYYDSNSMACINNSSGETVAAPPSCPEGEEFDSSTFMCKSAYEVSTTPAQLACDSSRIEGDQCVSEKSIPSSESKTFELAQYNVAGGYCDTLFVQSHDVSEIYCETAESPLFLNGQWYCAINNPEKPIMPVCPSGYVESPIGSSLCKSESFNKPKLVEPSNSMLLMDKYVSNVPSASALICSEGKIWNGTDCEELTKTNQAPDVGTCQGIIDYELGDAAGVSQLCQVDTQPAICESGYTLSNEGTCERVEIHEITNVCPEDYVFDGSHCQRVETSDLVYSCPDGMELISNEDGCRKVEERLPVIQCSEGEVLQNDVCVNSDTDDFAAICEAPYSYDAINNNCRLEEIEPINYSCGQNQTLKGHVCEEILVQPIIEECPPEFEKDSICKKVEEVSTFAECPLTYTFNGVNCVSTIDNHAAIICPAGSVQSTGKSTCTSIESTNTIYSCPSPYDLKNTNECHFVSVVSTKDSCPSGYQLTETGLCERILISEASTFCASGFSFNSISKRCERLVETSISGCPDNYFLESGVCYPEYSAIKECPDNYYLDSSGLCKSEALDAKTTLCPSGWLAGGNGQCYQLETTSGDKVCPTGFYLQNGECVEDVYTDITGCPEGYSLHDGGCKEATPILYDCPDGWTTVGDKCQVTLNDSITECPEGYVLQNNVCHSVVEANQNCPSGYVNDGDGTCSDFDSANVTSCPSGYFLENGSCVRVVEANQNCPSGYVNDGDGTCSVFDSQDVINCPAGYALQNGSCYHIDDFQYSCAEGTYNGSGQCVTYDSQPIGSCPYSYQEAGGYCYKTTDPEFCSTGYEFENGQCVRYESVKKSCPDGYLVRTGGPSTNWRTQCVRGTSHYMGDYCIAKYGNGATYNENWDGCRTSDGHYPNDSLEEIKAYFCSANEIKMEYYWGSISCHEDKPEDVAVCPDGYSYQEGRDWNWEGKTYYYGMCTKGNYSPVNSNPCPSGYDYDSAKSICSSNTPDKTVGNCPTGYNLNQTTGQCEIQVTETAESYCQTGYSVYQGNQCIQDAPDPSVGSCATGYTLNELNGNCERTLHDSVIYSCNSGYTIYQTDECKSTSPSLDIGSCASGFTLNASTGNCERTLHDSVEYTCSSGYSIYQTEYCAATSPSYNIGSCETGFTLNSSTGICEQDKEEDATEYCLAGSSIGSVTCPSQTCDEGFSLVDGQCQKLTPKPVSTCDAGYVLIEGACHSIIDASSICPPDHGYKNGQCFKRLIEDKTCPVGYVRLLPDDYPSSAWKYQCVKGNQYWVTDYCETEFGTGSRYIDNSDQCIDASGTYHDFTMSEIRAYYCSASETDYEYYWGSLICHEGTYENVGTCPDGYSYLADREWPVDINGQTFYSGSCAKEVFVEQQIASCDVGYVMVNNECHQLVEKSIQCQTGQTLIDGFCEYEIVAEPVGCKSGYVENNGSCLAIGTLNGNCPQGGVYLPETNVCTVASLTNALITTGTDGSDISHYTCPNSSEMTGNPTDGVYCLQQTTNSPNNFCDSGYTFNGQYCLSNTSHSSGYMCYQRYSYREDTGMCVLDEIRMPSSSCPIGSVDYSASHCRSTTPSNEAINCPLGSSYDAPSGACTLMSNIDPNSVCPDGYLNYGDSQCRSINEFPSAANCPSGSSVDENGKCVELIISMPVDICPDGVVGTISQCRSNNISDIGLCPVGYVYMNGQCHTTEEYSGILSCPDTHYFSNGKCFPMVAKYSDCPTGYVLVGQQCELTESAAPISECSAGYEYSNGQCIKKVNRSFVGCQTGFELSNSSPLKTCHRTVPSIAQCPPNMNLVNGMCSSLQEIQPEAKCMDGFELLNATTCKKDLFTPRYLGCPTSHPQVYLADPTMCTNGMDQVIRQLTCKEGTDYDSLQGMCKETLTKSAVVQCPVSFEMVGDLCQREYVEYPIANNACPDGYTIRIGEEDVCMSVSEYPEMGICSEGLVRNGGECVNTDITSQVFTCAGDGYAKVGDSCLKLNVMEVERLCTIGLPHDLHYCKAVDSVLDVGFSFGIDCPTGYEPRGISCYKINAISISEVCNDGDVATPLGCQANNIQDSTNRCGPNQTLMPNGVCRSNIPDNEAGVCSQGFVSSDGKCYRLETMEPSESCTVGNLTGAECYQFEFKTSEPDCPYGYQFDGSQCIKQEIENIIKRCKNEFGVLNDSYCRKVFADNIQALCGVDEYFSTEVQACVERQESPRNTSCPDGLLLNQDTGICQGETIVQDDPLNGFVCPSGYWYETDRGICVSYQEDVANTLFNCPTGYNIHFNECRKTENVSATFECPVDTVMVDSINKMCAYTAMDINIGSCPAGFVYDSSLRICTSAELIKAKANCPDETLLNDSGLCLRTVDTLPLSKECTAPFMDVEGYLYCVKEETAVATPSCPDGFVYHTGLGRCVDENIDDTLIVCENGYALNASATRCEKLITTPVALQCDDRFVLDDGQCISIIPTESVSQCSEGYLYDPETNKCVQHQVSDIVYSCLPNYTFDDQLKACVRTDTQDAIEDCPTGFELSEDGDSCFSYIEKPAEPACPDNYVLDGIECKLVIKKSPASECPDGFTRRGENECVLVETSNPLIMCPDGYDYKDGLCSKTDYQIVERCGTGYTVINGGCYESELATFNCPAGMRFTRDDNGELVCRFYQSTTSTISCALGQWSSLKQGCVDIETTELIPESVPMCLPAQFGENDFAQGQFDSEESRCIHKKDYFAIDYKEECSGDLIPHNEVYCRSVTANNDYAIGPVGYEYDDLLGYFKKTITSTADISCHDDFSLSGSICQRELIVEPTTEACPIGFTTVGENTCEIDHRLAAMFICPEGYIQGENNICERTEIIPAF